MKTLSNKRRRSLVDRQARYWHTRINSGFTSERDRQQFAAWRSEHPAHAQAYAYLSALDAVVGEHLEQVAQRKPLKLKKPVFTTWRWTVVAATFLLTALVGFNLMDTTPQPLLLSTAVAELNEMPLEDGSSVHLSGNTRVEVVYSDQRRHLKLLQGQAVFDVEHAPQRPFIVEVHGARVRAVGTAFEVHKQPRGIVVSVLEGVVAVTPLNPSGKPVMVKAGQQFSLHEGDPGSLVNVPLERLATWRSGFLEFNEVALETVVADINRHTDGQIVIAGDDIGDLPVTAVFKLGDFDQAADLLRDILPIRVSRAEPGRIVISGI